MDGSKSEIESSGIGYNSTDIGTTDAQLAGAKEDGKPTQVISVILDLDKMVAKEEDYQALVGQTIKVGPQNSGVYGIIQYCEIDDNGGISRSMGTGTLDNLSPDYYIKINSVVYDERYFIDLGIRAYRIEGEFNVQMLGDDSTVRKATNGKFNLLFRENK